MEANNITSDKFVRSFGRVKARRLSQHKKDLFENLLPEYQIDAQSLSQLNTNSKEIHLEIGFGFGDFIFENAKKNPDKLFIGCEPHINGVVNLLAKVEQKPLDNLKIFVGDGRIFLDEIPDHFFNRIYILNPDPWPKTKHQKRRLVNKEFLEFLHTKIKPNNYLNIATDSNIYKEWVMREYFRTKMWNWVARSKYDWKRFPKNWVKTKYQKKAEIAGRENAFLQFIAG